jgi:hypothetical protein
MAGCAGDHLKEQTMKVSSRVHEFARSAGLILVLAGPFAACASDTGSGDSLDQSASDLKGGAPSDKSKGKGKGKVEVAGGPAVVEDAGVVDGKGNGKGQDKAKKDKTVKTHGKGAGEGAAGGDADEAADEQM